MGNFIQLKFKPFKSNCLFLSNARKLKLKLKLKFVELCSFFFFIEKSEILTAKGGLGGGGMLPQKIFGKFK